MGAAPVLSVYRDGEKIGEKEISGESFLGREEGCLIRLQDRAISRQHALLRPLAEGIQVERRSEFSPLIINGEERTRALLKDGDILFMGPYQVRISYPIPVPAPKPVEAPVPAPEVPVAIASPDMTQVPAPTSATPTPQSASIELVDSAAVNGAEPKMEEVKPLEFVAPDMPMEASPVENSGATKLVGQAELKVSLIIPTGAANVTELEMTGAEVLIGRTKDCQIQLSDKKCSRRHAKVIKNGLRFVVRDLDTVNGTFLNGQKIEEAELNGDDVIKIGDTEIRFCAGNPKLQDQIAEPGSLQGDLNSGMVGTESNAPEELAVPQDMFAEQPLAMQPMDPLASSMKNTYEAQGLGGGAVPQAMLGTPAQAAPVAPTPSSQAKRSLLEKFRDMPKRRQLIVGLIVIGLVVLTLFEEEKPKKGKQDKPAQPVAGQQANPTFEKLKPEDQRFVQAQHQLGLELYKNKEYDKAIFEIQKIFKLVPDYENSREIERYAQEGKRQLEAKQEEAKKKAEEERIKARVTQLKEQAQKLMGEKRYGEMKDLFVEILSLDPENPDVAKWQAEIDEHDAQTKLKAQNKNRQKEAARLAQGVYRQGLKLQKAEKFIQAIAIFKKAIQMGVPPVAKKARYQITECRRAIAEKVAPLLDGAKTAEEAGELGKAYKLFAQAQKIDPSNKIAIAGMDRAREGLTDKSKTIYTEGVLAESYSDFETAYKKFNELLQSAPDGDIYYERAKSKLKRYAPYGKPEDSQ